jgi:hypothetical protein
MEELLWWIIVLGLAALCALMIFGALVEGSQPKGLKVGDKMPADDGTPKNYGAFIKVCPCCDRIDEIFVP